MKKQHLILLLCINMSIFSQNIINEKLIPFHDKQGKWGYIDADSDKIVIAAKYDFANLFENGIALVRTYNLNPNSILKSKFLLNFIKENGNKILPLNAIKIDFITNQKNTVLKNLVQLTLEDGTIGILKLSDGQFLVKPAKYNDFKFYTETDYVIDNKILYSNGVKYEAPKGYSIQDIDFENNFFAISKPEKKEESFIYGISNWDGKIIIEPKYNTMVFQPEVKKILASKKDFNLSLIIDNYLFDEKGALIATFKSDYAPEFNKENFTYTYNYNWKIFHLDSKTGKLINDSLQSDYIYEDAKSELYGIKNSNDIIIVKPKYFNINILKNNLVKALKNVKEQRVWGIIDKNEKEIIPFIYQEINEEINEQFIVEKNDKWGIIDLKGKQITPIIYDRFYFENGFANAKLDSGEGVIDANGKIIIDFTNDKTSILEVPSTTFEVNSKPNVKNIIYFFVEKNNKQALFDEKGKQIIPFKYGALSQDYDIKNTEKGWFITQDYQGYTNGLINIFTNVVIPPVYENIKIYFNYIIAKKYTENGDVFKIFDLDGKLIKEDDFDAATPESDNLIKVVKNNNAFFINIKTGKEYRIKE